MATLRPDKPQTDAGRECRNLKSRRWRQENREYVRKANRRNHADHYARNRDKVIEQTHQYYEANKPTVLHKLREYNIRKQTLDHAIHRLKREIERISDWIETRDGLATPKGSRR